MELKRRATPIAVDLLFSLERLIYGLPADDTATATRGDLMRFGGTSESPDLVLDFTVGPASADTNHAAPTWCITFDGVVDETAALAALVYGHMPIVAISDAATNVVIMSGRPGTETAGILTLAYRDLLARTMLIVAALDGAVAGLDSNAQAKALDASAVARFAAKSLARAAVEFGDGGAHQYSASGARYRLASLLSVRLRASRSGLDGA